MSKSNAAVIAEVNKLLKGSGIAPLPVESASNGSARSRRGVASRSPLVRQGVRARSGTGSGSDADGGPLRRASSRGTCGRC